MKRFLIYTAFIFLLVSCSDTNESNFNAQLSGRWESTFVERNIETTISYSYQRDGTYTYSVTGTDVSTRQFLGFKLYEEGNFDASNERLDTFINLFEINTDGNFNSRENLEVTASGDGSFFYTLDPINKRLTLTPICSASSNCTGPRLFERVIAGE